MCCKTLKDAKMEHGDFTLQGHPSNPQVLKFEEQLKVFFFEALSTVP